MMALASESRMRVWVWVVAGIATLVNVWLSWLTYGSGAVDSGEYGFILVIAVFTVAGAMILSHQPSNVVGWLLMVPGLTSPVAGLAGHWLGSIQPPPQTLTPLIFLAVWFNSIGWVLLIFPVFYLMLVFPSGRLASPKWRWVAGLGAVMLISFVTLAALSEELTYGVSDEAIWTVPNPIGFLPESFWNGIFSTVWGICLFTLTVGCVSAVIFRFRRAGTIEREQMKWLLLSVAFFGIVYGSLAFVQGDGPHWLSDLMFAISLTSIPISIAIAVLRYRLYEIDRIVSRTVSYTLVVGLLAGVFLGVVSLLTLMIPSDSNVTVAASTLAVAALFNPLRRRTQTLVDRRFNRSHYDTQRVMDGFAASLRDQIDPEQVVNGWTNVVEETMQPASIGTWLRSPTTG